jgi:thiamine kinase-like enzyme
MMNENNVIAVRSNKKVYKEDGKAIKVFNSEYRVSDVLNEALNQARVEEARLNIPKLVEVKKIGESWAIVSEFIEGKTLEQLMIEDPDNLDEYLDRFVNIQLEIHKNRAPMLNKLKDKMNAKISAADIDATTRYELHTRLESMPKHTKICHGDFCPSNVICCPDGKDYIIDWSHATQGNASADVARTYLRFCLDGRQDIANIYLMKFCRASDTARQYVERWLPIVAASQSVKGKPEEREFLMKWVDVLDYE